jgi:hypothetical protein
MIYALVSMKQNKFFDKTDEVKFVVILYRQNHSLIDCIFYFLIKRKWFNPI